MGLVIVLIVYSIVLFMLVFSVWLVPNLFSKIGSVVSCGGIMLGFNAHTEMGVLMMFIGVLAWLHFMADYFESIVKGKEGLNKV